MTMTLCLREKEAGCRMQTRFAFIMAGLMFWEGYVMKSSVMMSMLFPIFQRKLRDVP